MINKVPYNEGKLIWITGLSGSGKTTIGKNLYDYIKQNNNDYIHLDGDDIRIMLGDLGSFSVEGRKKTAETYSRMCKYLTGCGINVIISTISLYHSVHEYNRKNNKKYFEILLEVDKKVLITRNKHGLYNPGVKNVMSIDQVPEFPNNPDLKLNNNLKSNLKQNVTKILDLIGYIR